MLNPRRCHPFRWNLGCCLALLVRWTFDCLLQHHSFAHTLARWWRSLGEASPELSIRNYTNIVGPSPLRGGHIDGASFGLVSALVCPHALSTQWAGASTELLHRVESDMHP